MLRSILKRRRGPTAARLARAAAPICAPPKLLNNPSAAATAVARRALCARGAEDELPSARTAPSNRPKYELARVCVDVRLWGMLACTQKILNY